VRSKPLRTRSEHPALVITAATALAAVIFAVDAFTPLAMAVAVLYVLVILLAATICNREQVVSVTMACLALTLLAFFISHGIAIESTSFLRCLVSLAAIAITAILVLRNKKAEDVLREQANLLDVTHDAIIVRGLDDVIQYWNRGAEQLYGWDADAALGNVSHELLHTDLHLPLSEITERLHATGKWEGEITHVKSDGTRVTVASRWSLQRDERGAPIAVLETNNDVSERRRAENALRRSEAHLAQAQQLSLTGSFGWQPATGDIIWSAETYRIFEYDPASKPTTEMILARAHPADRAYVSQILNHADESPGGWEARHRLLFPDGRIKFVRVVAHSEPDEDGTQEFVGAIMDVTAARRAEDDLRQAQSSLAHANRVSTLGEMTASIAHEVSQPIAAMIASAGAGTRWLAAGNLDEVRQSLSRISRDGHRASDVISNIRAMARKSPPRNDRVNINEAIREVAALARGEAERGRTEVRLDLGRDLPHVAVDRVQIQQVLLNLVVNAIEAMHGEAGPSRELTVTSRLDGSGTIVVSVRDNGPGLDDEQLSRVFDAFYTTKSNGIGMGLAICKSIIEAHEGRLWVERADPHGAIFNFKLPSIDKVS
jgi:PAS domain S-box-containing protein